LSVKKEKNAFTAFPRMMFADTPGAMKAFNCINVFKRPGPKIILKARGACVGDNTLRRSGL
jgi:hypothetical protein